MIKDLKGREPIGCVITIGVKEGGKGRPIETDRFHIVQPREENGVRVLHPAFKAFNSAAPDQRRVIRGNLVHARRDDCFEYQLKAQVLPRVPAHPDRRPHCVGDGVHALRWMQDGPDDFATIKCPNDRCEYRVTNPPSCKPFSRLLFRVDWKEGSTMPNYLAKFTTGSWNTTANLLGMFDYIDQTARNLGLSEYTLFGLPFVMTLTRQTKPSRGAGFPVVTFSPTMDPIAFFQAQRQQIESLQSANLVALPDVSDPDEVFEDVSSINVPHIEDEKK